jgi:hypothetical protein
MRVVTILTTVIFIHFPNRSGSRNIDATNSKHCHQVFYRKHFITFSLSAWNIGQMSAARNDAILPVL